ncbi:MAG TPA: alpha/beta hydrolase family protein [Solirubrobacterales bacterium]
MTDLAAILPTSVGPVGAIVSEPSGPPRGALVFLQGGGAPCRAGVNAAWARLARSLADRGIAVLRFDFIAEGDSTMVGEDIPREVGWRQNANLTILRELAPWFRARTGVDDLLLAGSCHGGRVALELAAEDPRVKGSFLIVPYLWNLPPNLLPGKQAMRQKSLPRASELFDRGSSDVQAQRAIQAEVEAVLDQTPLEDNLVEICRRALEQGEIWILTGEGDSQKPVEMKERLGESGERLEVEIVPGTIIHPVTHPEILAIVTERLTERLLGAVDVAR